MYLRLPSVSCKVQAVFGLRGFFPLFILQLLSATPSASRPVHYCTDLVGPLALLWEKEEKMRLVCFPVQPGERVTR